MFLCCGVKFGDLPKKQRQSSLYKLHRFTCNCEPCKNNWPESDEDFNKEVTLSTSL